MALLRGDLGPEAVANPGDDPHLLGLQALQDEAPQDTAEWAREQGNAAVRDAQEAQRRGQPKQRHSHLARALEMYSQAIDLNASSPGQLAVYRSNRAHVHLLLGNNGHALADAQAAADLDASNVKALYRGAKAALLLGQCQKALDLGRAGLEAAGSAGNAELETVVNEASRKLQEQQAASTRSHTIVKAAQDLCLALTRRKVTLGKAQFQEATRGRGPQLDASTGLLHWPVVLCYPEPMSLDLIEDFCETDSFSTQLKTIFASGADAPPLEWDKDHAYRADSIELYYRSNSSKPLSSAELLAQMLEGKTGLIGADKDEALTAAAAVPGQGQGSSEWAPQEWRRVDLSSSLGHVLSRQDYVTPGVPVFYVVSSRSPFKQVLLSGGWTPPQ